MGYYIGMQMLTSQKAFTAIGAILVAQVGILLLFGQPPICTCGYIKFWEGVVRSAGNSQHLSDWYTFSHIIHGFVFYWFVRYAFPQWSVMQRLVLALSIEVGWEIAENTPYVINLYRQQALSLGYVGDSVINSVSDSISMIFGYILAWRLPVWSVVILTLAMELVVAYFIHDNLMLNVLNFIYQFDAVQQWQSAV